MARHRFHGDAMLGGDSALPLPICRSYACGRSRTPSPAPPGRSGQIAQSSRTWPDSYCAIHLTQHSGIEPSLRTNVARKCPGRLLFHSPCRTMGHDSWRPFS